MARSTQCIAGPSSRHPGECICVKRVPRSDALPSFTEQCQSLGLRFVNPQDRKLGTQLGGKEMADKKNYDPEVLELPELEGLEDLEDIGADLFSSENLKFMAEVAAGGSLAVLVSEIVDSQVKKIETLGPYLKYVSPAVPFAIALAAAKFVLPNPRWRDVGVGMIAASAGVGILQILKNYGMLGRLGLEGPALNDLYIPDQPLLEGVRALPSPQSLSTISDEAMSQIEDKEPEMIDEGFGDVMLVNPAMIV